MVNIAQVITGVLILAAFGVGAWVMNMFFGIVGVVMLGIFLLPVLGVMFWLASRNSSGSTSTVSKQSKGARSRE